MISGSYPKNFRVEHSKVTEYLLNEVHPAGRSKAKFFLAFGFTRDHPERLAIELAKQAFANIPGVEKVSAQGLPTMICDGAMLTPDGRNPKIRTVWTLTADGDAIFVTAYPRR